MRITFTLICALFFAACSTGPDGYSDVDAVVSALREGGIECDEVETAQPAEIVGEQATCRTEGGEYAIFVFTSEEKRDRWLTVGAGLGEIVVGPNWAIDPGDDAAAVAAVLGGDIR